MRINWKIVLFVLLISYGAIQHFLKRPLLHDGVSIAFTTTQQLTNQADITLNGYNINPLQTFTIKARVLSATHYFFDREADLSPVDLALGWGPMSDDAILKNIKISQANRFYYWKVNNFFIPRAQIEKNSANMHMIPANDQIEKTLKTIKTGQLVEITGYLVEATAANGWRWKSSLSREDVGAGACELVYVKTISVN